MKSFDEWFESQKRILYAEDDKWVAKKGWEARQAEVDELQTEIDEFKGRIKYLESVKNGYRGEVTELQKQTNELQAMYEKQGLYAFELQKRIDEALKVLNGASPTMLDKKAIKILKGNQNE